MRKSGSRVSRAGGKSKLQRGKKTNSSSCLKGFIEFVFFIVWLLCTGIGGYFVGHTPAMQVCPPPPEPEIVKKVQSCVQDQSGIGSGVAIGAESRKDGYAYDELSRMWKCSHAEANASQADKQLFPKEGNLGKTKWKNILQVDPKAFFDKYLTQYPGDTRSVQPVVVFSHKPLERFDQLSDVCKVLDVALVPDTPGICVAVTETYHDVASYHMLHADKQPDGSFALTSNSLDGRTLPEEAAYASARALLLEYFTHHEAVDKAVKACPKFNKGRVIVGVLVETEDELSLFKNSFATATKEGVSSSKFCSFSSDRNIANKLSKLGIKSIHIPELSKVGTEGQAKVSPEMRRHFLQAWLAFAVANANTKMMWQSPGTIWLDRPDNIVTSSPIVELLWGYKGRNDQRAAPFFVSYDFFVPTGHERPVHLTHEIIMHFDLVLAWGSLDAVVAYRLSENNARYGTTSYVLPPFKVLHVGTMGGDPTKIREAVISPEKPQVIVFPTEGTTPQATKELIKSAGLWFSDE